jgi:4a-hydroxytetrahydrobiopterin dehydratase
LEQLEGWEYIDGAIETSFEFENFKEAFSVMTRIAFECEAQGHHPDWSNVYNSLHIRLNTHDAEGVTEKDFKLAKTIEGIIDSE